MKTNQAVGFSALLVTLFMGMALVGWSADVEDKEVADTAEEVVQVLTDMDTPAAAESEQTADEPQAGPPAPFSPEISAEFMRRVMETSARIEAVKKEMAERRQQIYDSHPEVKQLWAELLKLQAEINQILASDAELVKLEAERDIAWTTMPRLPRGNFQGGTPHGFAPLK